MRKSTILGTLLAFLPLARGALYPTRPIAKTTLHVGKDEMIKWTDDGKAPHLSQMGPMKLDLFAANNTYLCTLSDSVDPTTRSLAIALPPGLDYTAPRYALHFVPHHSRYGIIYTADFAIADKGNDDADGDRDAGPDASAPAAETDMMPFAATLAHDEKAPSALNESTTLTANETAAPHLLTLVLPSTTLTTTLAGAAVMRTPSHFTVTAPSVQETAPSLKQADEPEKEQAQEEDEGHDGSDGHGDGARNVSSVYHPPIKNHEYNSALRGFGWSSSGAIDWERLKFKLVFIVWPAMVGISMAV
ncbi:uncharacterized protein SCHCODRAFT_02557059 [Schizophyllum commune H4-8]|uniref:Expressed protein n=1 Tax=Schizophyllum commune (strain H4-8 / FGSC 9210) TaxID=578458 RepID=D8QJT7_SCHCM|nr:uncharacterized protein SCHCODRAFT_02557059 [Schizophyllum commune H4-8]KAI5885545.1 hypothetical protein SCHCODRAFT_02557059 [Schizophyllum commune H4-8]